MHTEELSTHATMNYSLVDAGELAHYFYDPGPNVKFCAAGSDPREVKIADAWGMRDKLSVDQEGFEIHDFDPSFNSFDSDSLITDVFYDQVIDFVKATTGAREVKVFDHTIRRRLPAEQMHFKKPSAVHEQQTSVKRPAVLVVHSDYTPVSGPKRVHEVMGERATDLLKRRVAFFNVWKPLNSTVEELPLAMMDATSQEEKDYLIWKLRYADRTGEIFAFRYSPKHRWCFFPNMNETHALLLKTYDSEVDGRCRFMGHSAFEHPDTAPDAKPRESIEVRTMAFF